MKNIHLIVIKKRSMQFVALWRLSQAMKFNLVIAIGELLDIPFETKVEKALRAELTEKEELIKTMEIEVGVYKRIVEKWFLKPNARVVETVFVIP